MDDSQSYATAHTNETPYPGSRGQGGPGKGGGKAIGKLPEVKSPRSPRAEGGGGGGGGSAASPSKAGRSPRGSRDGDGDDDDASHASSITNVAPARGVDIGMMAQREVQKQFKLAERMHQERSRRGEAMTKDEAEIASIEEQIAYIKKERLDRLDRDLVHRKHMHETVSKEFDAAMKRLHRLVEDQRATANRSVNKNANITGKIISTELAAARGYSMKGKTQCRRRFFKKKSDKLPPVGFSPVVPG